MLIEVYKTNNYVILNFVSCKLSSFLINEILEVIDNIFYLDFPCLRSKKLSQVLVRCNLRTQFMTILVTQTRTVLNQYSYLIYHVLNFGNRVILCWIIFLSLIGWLINIQLFLQMSYDILIIPKLFHKFLKATFALRTVS